jgi:hypothetical protein
MEKPCERVSRIGHINMSPIKSSMVYKVKTPPTETQEISNAHIEKARVAAAYIKLIHHSQECFGNCSDPRCEQTRKLVSHCIGCNLGHECKRPGCIQTKALINHAQDCKMKKARQLRSGGCLICSQIESARTDADVESLNAVVDAVDGAHGASTRHVAKAKEAARYIDLINHSQNCPGDCGDAMCPRTKELVRHCLPCRAGGSCTHPGCRQTKLLMNHMQECKQEPGKRGQCMICGQLGRSRSGSSPEVVTSPETSKKRHDEFPFPMLPKRFRIHDIETAVHS